MASFRKNRGKHQTEPVEVPRAGVTRRDLPEPKPAEKLTQINKAAFGSGMLSTDGIPAGVISDYEIEMNRRLNLTPEGVSQEIERDRRALATPRITHNNLTAAQLRQQRNRYDTFGEAVERCRLEQQYRGSYVDYYEVTQDGRTAGRSAPNLGVFHGVDGMSGTVPMQITRDDPRLQIESRIHANSNAGNPLALAADAWIDQAVRQHLAEAVNIMEERYSIRRWQTSFILVPDGCPALVGRFEAGNDGMVVAGINFRNMYLYEHIYASIGAYSPAMSAIEQFQVFLVRMVTSAIPALQGVIRP